MPRSLHRAALTTALSLLSLAVLPALPAHAAGVSICQTGSGTSVSVTVFEGDPIKMSTGPNGEIELTRLLNGGGTSQCQVGPYLSPVPATTANTDYVTIGSPSNDLGDDVTIDLRKEGGGRGFVGAATPGTGLAATHFVMTGWTGHHLTVEGSNDADEIRAVPNAGLDLDDDGDSDLTFSNGGSPGSTTLLTIDGNDGHDVLDVSPPTLGLAGGWPFALHGGYGDDVLRGSSGDDVLDGGPGQDQIVGGLGTDTVTGGDDDDTVRVATTLSATPYSPVTIPNGTGTSAPMVASVPYGDLTLAYGVRVHLSLTHPHPEHLQVVLHAPSGDVTLMDGSALAPGSGANVTAAVFVDDSTPFPGAASAPYTGTFSPASGTLLPLQGYAFAGGSWSVTATDTVPGEGTGTIDDLEVSLFGSATTDAKAGDVDGGAGADTLSYLATSTSRVFTATSPTAGTVDDGSSWAGVEKLTGSSAGDEFAPSSGTDDLDGGPGDDTFHSSLGSDTIMCGDGQDSLLLDGPTPGASVDLDTGGGVGTSTHDGGTDTVTLCENVTGTNGNDTLVGSAEGNSLSGRGGDDVLTGLDGSDTISDGSGADTVDAGDGADTILPREDTSADSYVGGDGPDLIDFTDVFQGVHVTLDDVADDGVPPYVDDVASDVEAVTGTSSDDVITGSAAGNVINAGAGTDTVEGGAGNDTLSGGGQAGDVLSYAHAPAGVTVDLATAQVSGGDGDDLAFGFSTLVGSAHDDVLSGDSAANTFRPGLGNDTVTGHDGADRFVAASTPDGADSWDSGGDAGDTVDYTARTGGVQLSKDGIANDGAAGEGDQLLSPSDVLLGGLGPDVLIGGALADSIDGGPGNDSINGRGGDDVLWGGTGDDVVNGSSGNDTVDGADGNDTVLGGDGDDTLHGSAGNDRLIGSSGDDDEYGGLGNDAFVEGDTATPNGSDLLRGEAGTDSVSYSGRSSGVRVSLNGVYDDGATTEQDNVSNDVEGVDGTAYADTITGSSAANVLHGLGGNDVLNGLTGNDTVDGGTGNDSFLMGSTADGRDVYVGGTGIDVADYRARTTGLVVSLNGIADDGATGEADNVRTDVENVYGGGGSDRLYGSAAGNRLLGYAGNDQLTGGTGADYLDGGTGNDWFFAKDGVRDTLVGGAGIDVLKSYDTTDARSSIP